MRPAALVALAVLCLLHAHRATAAPAAPATTAAPAAAPAPPTPAASATPTTPTTPAATAAPASCIDDARPYAPASVRAHVARLAAPELDGRAPGSPGDAATRRFLVERFRCLGLVPGGADGSYEQPFTADGHATANVIGLVLGDDPAVGGDIIVVGAHHDHLGDGHLGANDDASGLAGLLAIAQATRQRAAPHRTIAFIAFGGEELGLVGSTHFAAHPPAAVPLDRVVYDVNLDMIGSYGSAGAVYAMGTFAGLAATPIVQALARARRTLKVATGGRGVGSDHEAFCRAGVPYVFLWTPDKRCYHARCDTIDHLDAAHTAAIAELAGALIEQLSDRAPDLAGARARLGCTGHDR